MFARRLRAFPSIKKKALSFWSIVGLVALTMSFVGLQAANFTPIPGVRGHELTIPLDEPLPMYAPQPNAAAAESVGLGDDIPMPTPIDAAGNAIPAPAAPQQMPATPFSIPSRFDTGPAAAPYVFKGKTAADTLRAAICLTSAIYYEAASESDDGQRAVAQVILNRVRHPAWPSTVCGVIYQGSDMPGCQFSYACDGSMARVPSREGWARASRVARAALAGYVHAPVGLATFYHTPAVNPTWNRSLIISAVIGNHIFYRMPGTRGAETAFYERYAGGEPYPGPLPRRTPWPTPAAPGASPVPVPTNAAAMPTAPYPTYQAAPPVASTSAAPPTRRVGEDNRYVKNALPDSDVLPQYRNSGQWIGD
jgi:hypothetical protein